MYYCTVNLMYRYKLIVKSQRVLVRDPKVLKSKRKYLYHEENI